MDFHPPVQVRPAKVEMDTWGDDGVAWNFKAHIVLENGVGDVGDTDTGALQGFARCVRG